MPWGNLRQNETLLDAAVRRLKEEVGYDADQGEVLCKVQSMMTREMSGCQCKGQPVMYVCSIFLMELNSTTSSLINPKYNASWFYPDQVRQFEEKGEVQALISAAVEQAENWNVTNDPYASYASNENSDYTEDESETEARREAKPVMTASAAAGGNSAADVTRSGGGSGMMMAPCSSSTSPFASSRNEESRQTLDPLRRLMHPRHRRQRGRP
uniref:Nudix hydrolase domain-containing protein n=1 Tax=Lotharella oceanica TaxID=641309 RepID=A0A7S2TJV2_9EUKA